MRPNTHWHMPKSQLEFVSHLAALASPSAQIMLLVAAMRSIRFRAAAAAAEAIFRAAVMPTTALDQKKLEEDAKSALIVSLSNAVAHGARAETGRFSIHRTADEALHANLKANSI